ncbi:hypothetical protein KLO75_19110 [Clostridioides difficile]|nr:hypothetical protein [Clostridioides difficile]
MPSLFWGFRLTIWNVNIIKSNTPFKIDASFRLTIWNVNFATYDGEMITLTGFILTMWYVKITLKVFLSFSTSILY